MKLLSLEMHEHEKTRLEDRRWSDMQTRIKKICSEKRAERNNAIRKAGLTNVKVSARVPGVPALSIGLGSDGMILDDNTPVTPRADTYQAAPGRIRGRSQSRRDRLARNQSWNSPNGTKHSPSGYRYSRNMSRYTPKGTRQRPRKKTPGGRAKYSSSPLRATSHRKRRGRRSSIHSSRTPSHGPRGRRPAGPAAAEEIDEIPDSMVAGPVTINGVSIPDGVCSHAYLGKKCPFDKANGGRGCKFRHDLTHDSKKPATPAPTNQSPPPAPVPAAPASVHRTANSPARAGEGRDDMREF